MEMSEPTNLAGQFQERCDEAEVLNLSVDPPNIGKSKLIYSVSDIPPNGVTVLLAIQNFVAVFGTFATYIYVISPKLCLHDNDPHRGYLLATCFFISGFASFLMSTFGIRLPVVQGISFYFLSPTLTVLQGFGECPKPSENATISEFLNSDAYQDAWTTRIRIIQGAIFMGGIFEAVVSLTGLVGVLVRFITPLTIAPIIIQLGINLMPVASEKLNQNIYVSILTILLVTIFSQYLAEVYVPVPRLGQPKHPKKYAKFFAFKMFGILISILIMWSACFLATQANWIPLDNKGRTDAIDFKLVRNSDWIRIPYPFQWGLPILSFPAFLTLFPAIFTSIIDSVGDYFACTSITQAPLPPRQVMGRGIFIEGLGQVASGLIGSGAGLSSYTSNIGAIAVTRAASRRVIQFYGVILMAASLCSKISGFSVLIPPPILSGVFVVMIGIMTAVGFSLLKDVDMSSPRNLFILGVALMLGAIIPPTITNPNQADITGFAFLDSVIKTMLSNGSLLSGIIGFCLDNTIPGTYLERGLESKSVERLNSLGDQVSAKAIEIYRLPFNMDKWMRKFLGPWPILLPSKALDNHTSDGEKV